MVKCTGVRQGKALICANCRTKQITRFDRQPGLEAAEGQKANFTWNGPREEWDAALHASLLDDTNEPEFVEEFAHCDICDQQLTAYEVSFLDHYAMCHPDADTRHLYSGEPEDMFASDSDNSGSIYMQSPPLAESTLIMSPPAVTNIT